MGDVLDILNIKRFQLSVPNTKESILEGKKKNKLDSDTNPSKPFGISREAFALLTFQEKKELPSLMTTDTTRGYKKNRAQWELKKVRPWMWTKLENPARKDEIDLYHWSRDADDNKEYAFSKFDKPVEVPIYTDAEYQDLKCESWSRDETDHLLDLAERFNISFVVMQDRWDREKYEKRSVEDLKDRYYSLCNGLAMLRAPAGQEPERVEYDADHERRRKDQLKKLFNRTTAQVKEEAYLQNEFRKIESRKRELEKKDRSLQKITASAKTRRLKRRTGVRRKIVVNKHPKADALPLENSAIEFPALKKGPSLGSDRIILPTNISQKKTRAMENLLKDFGIDPSAMLTYDIGTSFNELRSDMLYMFELRSTMANFEYEAETLGYQLKEIDPQSFAIQSSSKASAVKDTKSVSNPSTSLV